MTDSIPRLVAFLTDVKRLKLVKRKAYVSDMSRRENSAEHSWHLSLGLLAIAQELNLKIDLHKALVMALIHDVCESTREIRRPLGRGGRISMRRSFVASKDSPLMILNSLLAAEVVARVRGTSFGRESVG
jgi:HD domain